MLDEETPSTLNGVGSHPQSEIGSSYPLTKLLNGVDKSYDAGKNILAESEKSDADGALYRDGDDVKALGSGECVDGS